jgi:hypothetical protein
MQVKVENYKDGKWVKTQSDKQVDDKKVQLALCFGEKSLLTKDMFEQVNQKYPNTAIVMASTAGEIYQDTVLDNSLTVAALQFDKTTIKTAAVNIRNFSNSYYAATELTTKLPIEGLAHVLIFSDGNLVNGSELVKGFSAWAKEKIMVTGGLAGDGANFTSTLVGLDETPSEGNIVAVGFYGNDIRITHGSQGGWDVFGLEKRITKSTSNVLYEIEDQNALELYKKYLGDEADNLPASALLFPLSVTIPGTKKPVVRTILSINEKEKSLTFAGDVPQGSKCRFMKANFERLAEAASNAAKNTLIDNNEFPVFSLLISCVGRKLILGDKTVEEVKAVNDLYNHKTAIAGFYSYGEISPFNEETECQLHNQTMTITSFFER